MDINPNSNNKISYGTISVLCLVLYEEVIGRNTSVLIQPCICMMWKNQNYLV